jgi:hypothetical protein
MRIVVLGAAVALPVVTGAVLGLLGTGSPQIRFETTAAVAILTFAMFLAGYALFERFVQSGPADEFWMTILVALGGAAPGYRLAAGVPLHSVAGLALALGGPVVFIVGTILYLRARRARGLLAS